MWRAYIGLILCLLLAGCRSRSVTQTASSVPVGQSQCRISLIDEQHNPEFQVDQSALLVPSRPELRRAYFAMGCFWGSEAILASADGVVSTRVGFSGGSLENPSYSAIGDHVETVEVVYDPATISYEKLLSHFWKHHNARAKPIFRQYASAIFCLSDEELEKAKAERKLWQVSTGEEKILTAVLDLQKFYPAGQHHQKYYLQQDSVLADSLPSGEGRLRSLLATKLNAVAGRAGERESLEQQLKALGIDQKARELLFRRAVWPS